MPFIAGPPHRGACGAFLAGRVLLAFIRVRVWLWFIHFNHMVFLCTNVPQFLFLLLLANTEMVSVRAVADGLECTFLC